MCSLVVSPGVYQQLYGTDFPSCFLSVISLYVQGPGDSSFRYLPQKAVTLFPLLCCAPPHLCLLQDQVLGGHREKKAMGFASFFWECSSSDQRRKFLFLSVSGIVGPYCHYQRPVYCPWSQSRGVLPELSVCMEAYLWFLPTHSSAKT